MKKHDNNKFWKQFLFEDCLSYVGLFMSLRYRTWDLRMACLKKMVPLFTAYDHTCYERLIPRHLHDVFRLPDSLKSHFVRGAFSIRLKKKDWCGIALDECHEMKINKDCKLAITRPSKETMTHAANCLGFRAQMVNNLRTQVAPHEEDFNRECFVSTSRSRKSDANIRSMCETVACMVRLAQVCVR